MMGACLLVWCLGQAAMPAERITFTHEMLDRPTTERMVAYELPWIIAGFVQQTGTHNAMFGGVLPLTVDLFNGHLSLDGGVIVATKTVPRDGTHANFMTVARVPLTNRLAITYWHWSNANIGNNPSVNALGVSLRLRARRRS